MADFFKFLPHLLKFEGGFVDDPHDPGGMTNKGVTLSVFKEYARPVINVEPSIESLKNLTDEQAAKLYKLLYWDHIQGDLIQFQPLAEIICDAYVNTGCHAITLFYKVMAHHGSRHSELPIITNSAAYSLVHHDTVKFYDNYKNGRIAYYQNLVMEHAILRRFLHGWINRVDAFPNITDNVQTKSEDPSCK